MLFCALKLVWDLLSRPSAQTVHPFICLSVYPSVSPLPRPPFVSLFLCRPVNPFILPFIHPSVFPCLVCPSVRPSARPPSFNSFVSLSVCPFVCQSIRFPVCLSFHSYIWVSVSPSINAFVYLSVCSSRTSIRSALLAISPSIRLSVRLSNHPSLYPFVRPSVRPSNHVSIYNGSWLMAPEIYHYYCKGIEIHACVQNRTLNAYYENQTLGFDENVDCLQVKPVHVSQTLDISKLTYFSFSICKNGLTTRTLTTQKTVIGTTVP